MANDKTIRTTVTLNAELLQAAQTYTGIEERSALVNEALRTLVAVEAGKRLAKLGGTMPDAEAPPRRRFG